MGIKGTITSTFSFKKSAIGLAEVEGDYFSQSIEVISCCQKIDIENRPDLVPNLHEVYLAAHEALEAAKNNKQKTPGEIDAAFEKVWDLLKEPDLNLNVEEIEDKQNNSRENDVKTQARSLQIMKRYQIKKANPPGKAVELKLFIGANKLTGTQERIPTEPFGNNQTLSTVLWLLIQSGKVRMDQNPRFYSAEVLESGTSLDHHFKIHPLSFDEKLEKSNDVLVLHVLVDASYRVELQSQDLSFYRNFGNIWSTRIGQFDEPLRIVKHLDGTLEATNRIDSQISYSRLALRPISGSASTSKGGENMWDDYLTSISNSIIGQMNFEYESLPEISGEKIEPQERQDSVPPQIQVPLQRQTRSQIAEQQKEEEMQLAAMHTDGRAKAKEEARLNMEAEKQERTAIVPECAPEPRSFWIDLHPIDIGTAAASSYC